jgi:O-antigen/teichoic acid export membrane protein
MARDAEKDRLIRWRILRGTGSNYLGKVITLATWFFLTPFILHRLGASDYGLWVLTGSVVAYGSLLDLGIGGAVVKYVAEHVARGEGEQAKRLVSTSLWLYTALGIVAFLLFAGLAPLFPRFFNVPPDQHDLAFWLVVLMGAALGISLPAAAASAVLQGLHRYDLLNLVSVTSTLLSAAASVTVLLLGGGLFGLVAVSLPVVLLSQLLAIWLVHRTAPWLGFGWRGARFALVRPVLSYSVSVFVVQFATRLQLKTDELVIGRFLPLGALAPYALARKLSELTLMLPGQFMKVLLPLASELEAGNDRARLRALYIAGTRLSLVIAVSIGGALILLSGRFIEAWVGRGFIGAAPLVVILAAAGIVSAGIWPAGSILQGIGRHRWLAVSSFITGVANIALSIILVQRLGVSGVALGTLIPTTAEAFLFILPYTAYALGISFGQLVRDALWPALLPVVPLAATLLVLERVFDPSSLIAVAAIGACGAAAYLLTYLRFGAGKMERDALRRVWSVAVQQQPLRDRGKHSERKQEVAEREAGLTR